MPDELRHGMIVTEVASMPTDENQYCRLKANTEIRHG